MHDALNTVKPHLDDTFINRKTIISEVTHNVIALSYCDKVKQDDTKFESLQQSSVDGSTT